MHSADFVSLNLLLLLTILCRVTLTSVASTYIKSWASAWPFIVPVHRVHSQHHIMCTFALWLFPVSDHDLCKEFPRLQLEFGGG